MATIMNILKLPSAIAFSFSHKPQTIRDGIERELSQPVRDAINLHERAIDEQQGHLTTMTRGEVQQLSAQGIHSYFKNDPDSARCARTALGAARHLGIWGASKTVSLRSATLATAAIIGGAVALPYFGIAAAPLFMAGAVFGGHSLLEKRRGNAAIGIQKWFPGKTERQEALRSFERMSRESSGHLTTEARQTSSVSHRAIVGFRQNFPQGWTSPGEAVAWFNQGGRL